MLLICYPKCSTCKKAEDFLKKENISYTYRDIKTKNPSYEELKLWYEKSGLSIKKFFNTSGLVYKSLNLKEKLDTMTDDEKLKLLATDGMLIKRPLAIKDDRVFLGFKLEEWQNLV